MLLLTLGVAVLTDLRSPSPYSRTFSVLLLVVILMLIAVGITHPPRQATRYVFFLYPVVVVIVATTGLVSCRACAEARHAGPDCAAGDPAWLRPAGGLPAGPRPRHRLGSGEFPDWTGWARQSAHHRADGPARCRTVGRRARRSAGRPPCQRLPGGQFLQHTVRLRIHGSPQLSLHRLACARGTVERWSNLPLLSTFDALAGEVQQHGRTFFVADKEQEAQLLAEMSRFRPTVVWRSLDNDVSVIRMVPDDGDR